MISALPTPQPSFPALLLKAPHASLLDLLPVIHRSGQGLWCFSIESTLDSSTPPTPDQGVIREIVRLATCGNTVAIISKQSLGAATEKVANAIGRELIDQRLSRYDASNIVLCGERGEYLVYHTGERFIISAGAPHTKSSSGIVTARSHHCRRDGGERHTLISIGTRASDLALPQSVAPEMRTVHVHFGPSLDIPPFGLPYQVVQMDLQNHSAVADFLAQL